MLAIVLGSIAGLAVGSGMAVLSPRVGLAPLAGALGVAALGLASVGLILRARARSAAEGEGAPAILHRSPTYTRASAASMVAAWAMLGVGTLPPVAEFLKVPTREEPKPPDVKRRPPEESPWTKAKIVLVGPGGAAVGLGAGTDQDGLEYLMVASADKKSSGQAVETARKARVKILNADAGLVGPLMKSVGVGHAIPAEKGVEVARLLFDRESWSACDLILTGPNGVALGLGRVSASDGKGHGYVLKAKAPSSLSDLAADAAFDAGRQVLEVDKKVLSTIAQARVSIGQVLNAQFARLIDEQFRSRRFTRGTEYVTFEDLQSRRRRVGICLGIDEKSVRLAGLLDVASQVSGVSDPSKGVEEVSRTRIPANSLRVLGSDAELSEASDLLEFFLYQMAGRLNSDAPVALRLAVLPTTVLDPVADARRRAERAKARARATVRDPDVAKMWDAMTFIQQHGPENLAKYAPEVRIALQAQILTNEVRDALSGMHVELREPSGPGAIEMAVLGLDFLLPPGEVDLRKRMRVVAVRRQLLGATHALASEIAPAQERGRYQLSMRLYEIDTGKLVWSGQGTRREAWFPGLGAELASYPSILNTGELTLLDFGNKSYPPLPRDIMSLPGGLPLRLGKDFKLTEAKALTKKFLGLSRAKVMNYADDRAINGYPVPTKIFTRLGYREQGSLGDPKAITFRDLFERETVDVPAAAIQVMDKEDGGTTPAPSFGSIPYAHQMRYAIWTLARGALPVGGRVGGQQDGTYRVKMGKDHRLRVKDRLVVRRPGEGSLPDRILATELVVTQVEADYVTAALADDQAGLPGAEPARSGDLVQRKATERIRVVVAPLSVIPDAPPPRTAGRAQPKPKPAPLPTARTRDVAERLTEMVAGGLKEVGVPLVERRELDEVLKAQGVSDVERQLELVGQTSVASHIVAGNIKHESGYYMVNLKMVDVGTGDVVASIAGYHFTKATMEAWKP